MTYTIPYDSTDFITASIEEVVKHLLKLYFSYFNYFSIFTKLESYNYSLIAVPVSIVGAFAGMYALGFSINLFTLLVCFAIGIVVDDAIIVIENMKDIWDGSKTQRGRFEAMRGNKSFNCYYFGIWSCVCIPVAFMGGLSGESIDNFITIVVSVLISGFVVLILTPSLCVRILKKKKHEPKGFQMV